MFFHLKQFLSLLSPLSGKAAKVQHIMKPDPVCSLIQINRAVKASFKPHGDLHSKQNVYIKIAIQIPKSPRPKGLNTRTLRPSFLQSNTNLLRPQALCFGM